MEVQFLEENHRKKFAILPYREYLKLIELAADEKDYKKALEVLQNSKDEIVDYDSLLVLENPIASQRKKKGLSQGELARKLKVDPSYISRLESSASNPSKSTLIKVAQALDCSMQDLL